MIMKNVLSVVVLFGSFSAFAGDVQVLKARACFTDVSTQISIGLSQAAHASKPGSKAEARFQKELRALSDKIEMVMVSETGCNEGSETQAEADDCIVENYVVATKIMAKKYKVFDVVKSSEACKGLL